MNGVTFDALGYFEKLKESGVPEIQAKAQVDVLQKQAEILIERLQGRLDTVHTEIQKYIKDYYGARKGEFATKEDIEKVQMNITSTKVDVAEARAFLRIELEVSRKDVDNKLLLLKQDILKWMFGMFITQSALLVALFSYLK